MGRRRLEDLHHQRGTDITACVTITAITGEGEISNLIVPNGAPGYVISPPMQKLGWRASDTRELSFQGARVPEGNLLGPRGAGLQAVPADPRRRAHLDRGDGRRPRAGLLRPRGGVREGARAVRPADRELPGGAGEARRHRDRDRGRADLVYKAAWEKDQGRDFARTAAMAKLYSGELSHRAANWALQIHGGYGFMDEYAISRLYRDQKILEIGEGTNEVQRMVIARHLGLS